MPSARISPRAICTRMCSKTCESAGLSRALVGAPSLGLHLAMEDLQLVKLWCIGVIHQCCIWVHGHFLNLMFSMGCFHGDTPHGHRTVVCYRWGYDSTNGTSGGKVGNGQAVSCQSQVDVNCFFCIQPASWFVDGWLFDHVADGWSIALHHHIRVCP